jgi:hypothetical protein
MSTIVGSRTDAVGNATGFFDNNTSETMVRLLPAMIDEDFVGAGHAAIPVAGAPATGYPWIKKTQQTGGAPTVAVLANIAAGVVAMALDATSEKQEASLYANDQLNWDMTKGAIFEARVAPSVLPSLTGVEMVLGLQSAWIDGPDNASFYARFQMNGSGVLNMQTKDGVNTKSVASGVTLVAAAFHIFRIDATDPTNVVFSVDGSTVSAVSAMTFAATGASAILQPYFSVYKPSGVGVATLQLDMVQVAANRV